ncbi:MAG: biopolymer transporter ExbD [Myxococcales bacterium]|nr:biopolymer transporter ExbD [Myxococcales bacterium]
MAMDLGSKNSKPGRATPNMNVTPLVDVVLVLLIIFMVITPLLAKQFWLALPNEKEEDEPQEQVDDDNKPVVISVTEKGEFKINHEVVPPERLSNKLKRVLAAKGQRTVFFHAEDDAPFGSAVQAMDLARGGGAATIAVLTDPI